MSQVSSFKRLGRCECLPIKRPAYNKPGTSVAANKSHPCLSQELRSRFSSKVTSVQRIVHPVESPERRKRHHRAQCLVHRRDQQPTLRGIDFPSLCSGKSSKLSSKSPCRSNRSVQGARASSNYVRVSSTLQTDIPFPEAYGVPLEQYMTETQRIFSAVFPDTHRSQRLSNDVWRIFMLPINFLFLTVRPVVDMRVWVHDPAVDGVRPGTTVTSGKAKKMVCLEAVKCDLRGLDYVLKPEDFVLGADGALYAERAGAATRLRGTMHCSISLAIPPALIFTPKALLETAGNAVMDQVLQNMKDKVNSQLLVDYKAYAAQQADKKKLT